MTADAIKRSDAPALQLALAWAATLRCDRAHLAVDAPVGLAVAEFGRGIRRIVGSQPLDHCNTLEMSTRNFIPLLESPNRDKKSDLADRKSVV